MKQIILPITVHLNVRLPLALLQPEPADVPTGRSRRPMPPGALRQKGTAAHLQQSLFSFLFCFVCLPGICRLSVSAASVARTLRMAGHFRALSGDGDFLRRTFSGLVVNAGFCLTFHVQRTVRRLIFVGRAALGSLIKACAAGVSAAGRAGAVHHNRAFAAALVCIVDTVVYTAGQISHDNSSYSVRSCS